MPWLSCQRTAPAEAAALQAARAVWSRGTTAEPPQAGDSVSHRQQQQLQQGSGRLGHGSGRLAPVVAAMSDAADADAEKSDVALPLVHPPQPPPPPPRAAAQQYAPAAVIASSSSSGGDTRRASSPACQPGDDGSKRAGGVQYQDGPLMLFVDTSALLSMLGCPGSISSSTCCTMKLLQALAGSGR
jgi:hypothetical protein